MTHPTADAASHAVRTQYERLPYPPIPWWQLPRRDQGESLDFARYAGRGSSGIRILIAGCGTFEPLVVTQRHPQASQVIAVDLSARSLRRLERRLRLRKLLRFYEPSPPITLACADLFQFEPPAPVDYVVSTLMVHHTADPRALVQRMAGWLVDGGMMRLVTYPMASRMFMRAVASHFKEQGIDPARGPVLERCRAVIGALPTDDPRRSTFDSCADALTEAGVVDAFFHACENPLSPLEWKAACESAGLELVDEAQHAYSRSELVAQLCPELATADRWTRLEILDRVLELTHNPVLWLRKRSGTPSAQPPQACASPRALEGASIEEELRVHLQEAQRLIHQHGADLSELLEGLQTEFGPRTSATGAALPGLTVAEYDWQGLLR